MSSMSVGDRRWPARLAVIVVLAALAGPLTPGSATAAGPVAGAVVSLLEAGSRPGDPARSLGQTIADADGEFDLVATRAPAAAAATYVMVDDPADGIGGPVQLATSLGVAPLPSSVVV